MGVIALAAFIILGAWLVWQGAHTHPPAPDNQPHLIIEDLRYKDRGL